MPSRTQIYQVLPWSGALNTSLDESLLQDAQLTIADNCIFKYQSAKTKREGINEDFDDAVFIVTHRSSSGTTRTLTGTFTNTGLVVGDKISVRNASVASYNVTQAEITVINGTTISYTGSGSLTEGSTVETAAEWANSIIGGIDYWVESSGAKTQYRIVFYDNGMVLRINTSGNRTRITDTGTAWTIGSGLTDASLAVFNNLVFIAVTGSGNKLKSWDGTNTANTLGDVSGAPECSILREHQGRLITNDKTDLNRWHYCATGDHTQWQGAGDSGAGDLGFSDGDPAGITGITPTFKGDVFIGKRGRLWRIRGIIPDYIVEKVSDGIGFASHNGIVAVDQDDIFFVSDKGFHSLAATDAYGSFSSAYMSADIQRSFVEDFTNSRRKNIQGAYVPELNSVAWSISQDDTENNSVWLFNAPLKTWYRWPELSCQALFKVDDTDRTRIYLGRTNGRLAQCLTSLDYDVDSDGESRPITWTVATGRLFIDGSPVTIKAFKRFGLIYRPQGSSTITASIKIDNYSTQTLVFQADSSDALLGSTWIWGVTPLGLTYPLSPYAQTLDGYGRGVKITLSQSGLNEQAEIQGFYIEWEPAGDQQETRLGDSS